ncbi:MAG: protein kinase [Acidobacteria bacterium]|nr:protein kinase [Acidobacteriota bacterium]
MGAPRRIGRYRVLGELGKGAMGTVYRGRDDTLDRDVALKVMSAGLTDAETRGRFLKEARAVARIQHPNIIVIYELGEHEGAPYMALELLEGVDLQRALDDGLRPDPRVTLPVVLQVLAGLGQAHENGIVHRDIKPSNVFLPFGRPAKIMDFGVARLAGPGGLSTGSGVVVGTPNYMSPEQVQGGDIDGRSDLFSVGLILYELATGEKAFKADTVVAVVFKILHEEVNLGLVPPGPRWERLRKVIRRALAREREERYPDAQGMSADLALAVQDLGGSVDLTAPADLALLVRPTPPPAPEQTPQSSAPTATLRTPRAPSPRRRASSGGPRPPRRPAPSPPRSRWALGLAWIFGVGAVGLLAFAGWLAMRPGPRPWSEPTPATPPPASSAPTAAAPLLEPTDGLPEPTPTATPSATPEPTPLPTREPTPTPQALPTPELGPEERLARASELMDRGRFADALAEAHAVLQRDPTNREATVLAQAAEEAVVIEECLANARKALKAGDRDRALAEVRRGLIINPSDSRLLELHGEVTRE